MFTNNQYYKKILEKLTSTTISGNHTDNYYIRRIAQEYGVEDTNKCNGRLLKAIAEIIAETTFNDFHFINFYLKKIAETLSEQTFTTVHSDNYYLGVFYENCVNMPYNDISAWTGDSIISYNGGTDPESATLSAQLLKGGNPASVEDVTITFKVSKKGTSDVVTILTADTGSDGKATVSYTARGLGDLCVETKIEGTSLQETYSIEDCIFYSTTETECTSSNNYITVADLSNLTLPNAFELTFDYKTNGEARCGLFSKSNFTGNPNYSVFIGSPNGLKWYYGYRETSTSTTDVSNSPTSYSTYVISRNGDTFSYKKDNSSTYTKSVSWFNSYNYVFGLMGWGILASSVKNIKLKPL